ncbi:MAG: hypothetical protein WA843_02345 [Candidatus Saccharimonadales bacterium]
MLLINDTEFQPEPNNRAGSAVDELMGAAGLALASCEIPVPTLYGIGGLVISALVARHGLKKLWSSDEEISN